MFRRIIAVAVLALLGLSACQPQPGGTSPSASMSAGPGPAPYPGDPPPFDYEAYTRDPAGMTERQVHDYIVGRTRMYYEPSHGTQISYSLPDGTTYLWYPGNRVVLQGAWMTKAVTGPLRGREQTVISLCYKYGENTYNPVTGSRGAQWICYPAGIWFKTLIESRSGDIFGLSRSQTPPFVLPKERTTLQALQQRAGGQR